MSVYSAQALNLSTESHRKFKFTFKFKSGGMCDWKTIFTPKGQCRGSL